MSKLTLLIVLAVITIGLLLSNVLPKVTSQSKFDSERWKSAYSDTDCIRMNMLDDLLNNVLYVGKSVGEIHGLLGEPEFVYLGDKDWKKQKAIHRKYGGPPMSTFYEDRGKLVFFYETGLDCYLVNSLGDDLLVEFNNSLLSDYYTYED